MADELEDVIRRFMAKVNKTDACWLWTGYVAYNGYGKFYFSRAKRNESAHRVSYQLFRGDIPATLQIDHLCRNRRCVNPDHLEAVTAQINGLRGIGPSAINAKKTHCPKGHPLDRIDKRSNGLINGRYCSLCSKLKQRERYIEGICIVHNESVCFDSLNRPYCKTCYQQRQLKMTRIRYYDDPTPADQKG